MPRPRVRDRTATSTAARSSRRYLAEGGGLVVLAIIVAVVVRTFVLQAYYIPSASMVPQLQVNDRVVVSRLAYDLHKPHRGDIVVFAAPPGEAPPPPHRNLASRLVHDLGSGLGLSTDQTVLIKRVIGLPGETVQGQSGRIYIDGRLLIEPYLPKTSRDVRLRSGAHTGRHGVGHGRQSGKLVRQSRLRSHPRTHHRRARRVEDLAAATGVVPLTCASRRDCSVTPTT